MLRIPTLCAAACTLHALAQAQEFKLTEAFVAPPAGA